ncbi:MAG: DUF362 domain-containing protein [Spirochaetota bacterium]|nr:DUF362 domain-containing protein [Spirochaetota bacterium]
MKQIVAVQQCVSYDPERLIGALRTAVGLAGGFDVADKRVLLKPNILRDAPVNKAVTTHPEFVRAAIRLCRELGAAEIMVGDSPGVHLANFRGTSCGIHQVVEEEGAVWVDFSGPKYRVPVPEPYLEKEFILTGALQEVDAVISLPKLKTHQLMGYTGAMKNLFGLLPGYAKAAFHVKYPGRDDIGRMIVDLVSAVKPHYALMDGIVGMEGPGPGNGYPRSVGLVAVSSSLLALDMIAAEFIGYRWNDIPSNRFGAERLDGIGSPDDIEVRGAALEELRPKNFQRIEENRPGVLLRILLRFSFIRRIEIRMRPRPVFDHDKCILCGECVAICASRALAFEGSGEDRRVVIQYKQCIRCYCCHEVCPADAISIV